VTILYWARWVFLVALVALAGALAWLASRDGSRP